MDLLRKQRLLAVAIVALVLLNLTTLGAVWAISKDRSLRPPPSPGPERHERMIGFLVAELGFDPGQADRLRPIHIAHTEAVERLRQETRNAKDRLRAELFAVSPELSIVEHATEDLGSIQVRLERLNFHYLRDLRELCSDEQAEKLKTLVQDVSAAIRPAPPIAGLPQGEPPPPPGSSIRSTPSHRKD